MASFPVSENLKKALKCAENIAYEYSDVDIGTDHILYGLIVVDCTAGRMLKEEGVTTEYLLETFERSGGFALNGKLGYTKRALDILQIANRISYNLRAGRIRTEHVLYAMLADQMGTPYKLLRDKNKIDVGALMRKLEAYLQGESQNVDSPKAPTVPDELADLGTDVTKRAREGKIDPIIGRSEEIERIVQILCRKTKNNPVLIGEPGVGKSAVVEGFAKAIVDGNVPELLQNKIVFSLEIGSLMAGTKYRGALEEKLKNAIDVVRDNGNIILFIDELHTLAQAGNKEGEVSPSDILKPYLARGELQTIGATTTDEYRKYIEKDKALERRFQPITVNPPSVEETIAIIKGLRENYESFHKVKLSDEAIVSAVKLSDRYIADRFLPDKAIDLIDEAMSKAKVGGNTVPAEHKVLIEKHKKLIRDIDEARHREDYRACDRLKKEREKIEEQMTTLSINWTKENERVMPTITAEDVAIIVSKWSKVPVSRLSENETQRLMGLEDLLHQRVIGQHEAIVSVSKAIRRARAGLKDPSRPIGTFLFMGPTGVGKTELTKALSEAMFDNENAVIRLDMSEYMESHAVSKLIGSPPGYVGYDEGGQLTEQVRRKPYSVVLFDEIEKAHPDVYNILLQIMDDGRLTDAQGRVVSFKNTIIIMTSNVGVADLKEGTKRLGFGGAFDEKQTQDELLENALRRHFKPEFLNRIDVVCKFHSLSKEDIGKIARILIKKFEKALKEKNITLSITDAVMDFIVERGYDAEYGARPLRRVIEQQIEDNVAEAIISGEVKDNSNVNIDFNGERVTINGK